MNLIFKQSPNRSITSVIDNDYFVNILETQCGSREEN